MPFDESVAKCRKYSCQGATALELGDCQQAERLLRTAVTASPQDADARRHLAETLWTRGERAEAIEHMRAAVKQEPDHAPTVCRLGQMEAANGAWRLALRRAEQALQDDPRLADAWALRGRAYLETGDENRAIADLFRALEYAPNDQSVLADLASLYAQQRKPHRWLATVHRLQETYPPGEAPASAHLMEADAYAALGRHDDAADRLRVAAARHSTDPALLCRLAEAEAARGENAAAIAAAQQALSVDQGHLPSQQLLARLTSEATSVR